MIYVTGDIHADIDIGKLSMRRFPRQRSLSKDDCLIVCGDFGLVWNGSKRELWWRKWLSGKTFTTLWIDGNHENFDSLRDFPVVGRFGGKVHEICPGIYHLMRGQVLTIDGKRFFVMGGAASHDKECRKEHVSWWKEEMPSEKEMDAAVRALDANGWDVDFVLTHCAPNGIRHMLAAGYGTDALTGFLEHVRRNLRFKHWFFGHYHADVHLDEQFTALYDEIVPIN